MNAFYGSRPTRTYFIGYSEGGRESLILAQRYPQDYDGIIAGAPVYSLQAEEMGNIQMLKPLYAPGGWINPTKMKNLAAAVYAACDGLDGVTDGIISAPQLCNFDPTTIRCAGGADTGDTCLSDPQIVAARSIATKVTFDYYLANSVNSYEGYPILEGGLFNVYTLGTQPTPNAQAVFGVDAAVLAYAEPVVRYQELGGDKSVPIITFDPNAYKAQAIRSSNITDATSPNISQFIARGGKLILTHGEADTAVSYKNTTNYYNQLVATYGRANLDQSVVFYLIPGFDHATGIFKPGWDDISALEKWVEQGVAPVNQVVGDYHTGTLSRTRPLCAYPLWSRYNSGEVNAAASFSCVN